MAAELEADLERIRDEYLREHPPRKGAGKHQNRTDLSYTGVTPVCTLARLLSYGFE